MARPQRVPEYDVAALDALIGDTKTLADLSALFR
jgi:hypothetical protein